MIIINEQSFVNKNKKIKEINAILYDEIISQIDITKLQCSCREKNKSFSFNKYGTYRRYHINSNGKIEVIRIQRVKCSTCGKTHALLLSSMVPFQNISLEIQVNYNNLKLNNPKKSQEYIKFFNGKISKNSFKNIIKRYESWESRIKNKDMNLNNNIYDISCMCIKEYNYQFLQKYLSNTVTSLYENKI